MTNDEDASVSSVPANEFDDGIRRSPAVADEVTIARIAGELARLETTTAREDAVSFVCMRYAAEHLEPARSAKRRQEDAVRRYAQLATGAAHVGKRKMRPHRSRRKPL